MTTRSYSSTEAIWKVYADCGDLACRPPQIAREQNAEAAIGLPPRAPESRRDQAMRRWQPWSARFCGARAGSCCPLGCALLTVAAAVVAVHAWSTEPRRRRGGASPAKPVPVADLLIEPTRFPQQYPAVVVDPSIVSRVLRRDRRCARRIRGDAARMCAAAGRGDRTAPPCRVPTSENGASLIVTVTRPVTSLRARVDQLAGCASFTSAVGGDAAQVSEVTVDLPPAPPVDADDSYAVDQTVTPESSGASRHADVDPRRQDRRRASHRVLAGHRRPPTPHRTPGTGHPVHRCGAQGAQSDSALAGIPSRAFIPSRAGRGPCGHFRSVDIGHCRGMTTSQSDFQLNRPGALIAALPAVLGFVPEKSLVLVTVDRGEMGCVMRVDLSPELFGLRRPRRRGRRGGSPGRRDRGRRRRRGRGLPVVQRRIPRAGRDIERTPRRARDRAARLPRRRQGRRGRTLALPWTRAEAAASSTTRRRRRWRWRRCWTAAGCTPGARSFNRSSQVADAAASAALADVIREQTDGRRRRPRHRGRHGSGGAAGRRRIAPRHPRWPGWRAR